MARLTTLLVWTAFLVLGVVGLAFLPAISSEPCSLASCNGTSPWLLFWPVAYGLLARVIYVKLHTTGRSSAR